MNTLRTLLAIVFSLLIVGGIWKYYTSNEQFSVNDPFASVWTKFATYTEDIQEKKTKKIAPTAKKEVVKEEQEKPSIHSDFTFGRIDQTSIDRLTSLGVVGGNPNGNIVWLHYCDFDATYCQTSFDEGIVYDYMQAYPADLQYIFKPFPVSKNEDNVLSHHGALCAMDLGTPKQYFTYYNSLYGKNIDRDDIDTLIGLGREIGIADIDDCLETKNYDLVIQQETKLAKNTFSLKALPANVFINKKSGKRVLVPGYYETPVVLPAIDSIK